jgi:CheY-like chemotaxis protein/predicted regulator of Ras-like GTPase activity (Roadblock/LC7/MglB family)
MSSKRVLVVDDDPDLLFLVAHGVKSLAPDYQVKTAVDGEVALAQTKQQSFDLIVTDYMMPGMTGLELIEKVHQFSPETQFILMTAHHDTNRIRSQLGDLELSGFVGKPFTMPDLMEVVQKVISQSVIPPAPIKTEVTKDKMQLIQEQLQALRRQTGAHTVLLVNSEGTPLGAAGQIDRLKASRLATFIASNFLAVAEMASLFGDNETVFKSSYYEGNKYNIFACDINGYFFLAVVFGARDKPGTVWFYAKQVAVALVGLLPGKNVALNQEASTVMARDFEDLVGDEKE